MIPAATGAVALVIASLVKEHGVQYVFATAVLAGLLQIGAGLLKLGALMRFVSRSVITGFVNALAILIFLAQLRSEEHTSELQSLMRISYAVFCLKKKKKNRSTKTELTKDTHSTRHQHDNTY